MKAPVTLLCLLLAGAVFAPAGFCQAAPAKKEAPAAKKEAKWQGYVVRIDKEHSTMDLRGGAAKSHAMRKVAYDSSTQWTKLGKPAQQDEFKDGSFVIVVGSMDQGVLHATRIDLRLPR